MGWSVGYDDGWERWIGYGVPAWCDHPDCLEYIDRGLAYVCGGEPYGGEHGCGLFFCPAHRDFQDGINVCDRCKASFIEQAPFIPKPEHPDWIEHVSTDASWAHWRETHPDKFAELRAQL